MRASISHSVGEREREREGWREEPAEKRRVEKSAEEVRCGNKHALGVAKEKKGAQEQTRRIKEGWKGYKRRGV